MADDGANVLRVAGPSHKGHFQVLFDQQVADAVHHFLALEIGQIRHGPALPFLILVGANVTEDVVVQSRPPHGVHGVFYLLTDRRVLDPFQQDRRTSSMHPVGEQRMEDGAGGGIGVLVEGYVNSGVTSFVDQANHPLAHAVHRAVKVGDVHRNAATLSDLYRLAERV